MVDVVWMANYTALLILAHMVHVVLIVEKSALSITHLTYKFPIHEVDGQFLDYNSFPFLN